MCWVCADIALNHLYLPVKVTLLKRGLVVIRHLSPVWFQVVGLGTSSCDTLLPFNNRSHSEGGVCFGGESRSQWPNYLCDYGGSGCLVCESAAQKGGSFACTACTLFFFWCWFIDVRKCSISVTLLIWACSYWRQRSIQYEGCFILFAKLKGHNRPLSMNMLLCVFSEVSGERRYSLTEVKIIVPQYKNTTLHSKCY